MVGVVFALSDAHFQKSVFEFVRQLLVEPQEELLEDLVVGAEEEVEFAVRFSPGFLFD